MSVPGFTAGLGRAYTAERERRRQDAAQREAQEMQLLQTLASYPELVGDDISQLAVAGIVDLVSGRKTKAGLAGWLGETEGSTALPPIRALWGTPRPGGAPAAGAPPAIPGGASLPPASPVEAKTQAPPIDPVTAAPVDVAPPPPPPGYQPPPTSPLDAAPLPGLPPPAPPETRREALKRQFPTAEAIAQQQEAAKFERMKQRILDAGGSLDDVRRATLGREGAPESMPEREPMTITYMDSQGREQTGVGYFDRRSGAFIVSGRAVVPKSAQRIANPLQPPVRTGYDAEGNMTNVNPYTGQVYSEVQGVGKPRVPPPPFAGGQAPGQGGGQLIYDRATNSWQEIPGSISDPNALNPEARQAKAILAEIDARIEAAEVRLDNARTPAQKLLNKTKPVLSVEERDAIAAEVSGGRYRTHLEARQASERTNVTGPGVQGPPPPPEAAAGPAMGTEAGMRALDRALQEIKSGRRAAPTPPRAPATAPAKPPSGPGGASSRY